MKRVLHSICIGSLALELTAWGQQASSTTTVKTKATKQGAVSAQTTTSAKTATRTSGSMAGTRFHQRANVSAGARSSAMRNTSANARIRARNTTMTNRPREQIGRTACRERGWEAGVVSDGRVRQASRG